MIVRKDRCSLLGRVALGLAACMMAHTALPTSAGAQLPAPAESVPFTDEVREGRQFRAFDLREAGDRAILNYTSFDIAANQGVEFIQPSAQAQVLNRIASAAPSRIDGQILANGEVFLLNPAGVLFGQSAVVDVAGLFAVAGSLGDQDFLAGTLRFTDLTGPVQNGGLLRAGGVAGAAIVALLGANVANSGQILAPGGTVVAVAGDDVLLTRQGSNVVVRLTGMAAGLDPEVPGIANSGTISADAGSVQLAVGDLYETAFLQSEGASVSARAIAVDSAGDGTVVAGAGLQATRAGDDPTSVSITSAGEVSLADVSADTVSVRAARIVDGSPLDSPTQNNVTAGTATLTATQGSIGSAGDADLDIAAQGLVRLSADGAQGAIAARVDVPPSLGAIEASATGDVSISARVSLPLARVRGDLVTLRAGTSIFSTPTDALDPSAAVVTARSGATLIATNVGVRAASQPEPQRGLDLDVQGPLAIQATGLVDIRSAGNLSLARVRGADLRFRVGSLLDGSPDEAPNVVGTSARLEATGEIGGAGNADLDAELSGPLTVSSEGNVFLSSTGILRAARVRADQVTLSARSILDGSAADELANVTAGSVVLTAGNGSIGGAGAADLDIEAGTLTARATGNIVISSVADLSLDHVTGTNVTLQGRSILDAQPGPGPGLEIPNVLALTATLTATGGNIGGPGNADLDVLALMIQPRATGTIFLDPILGFIQLQPGPVTLGALQGVAP